MKQFFQKCLLFLFAGIKGRVCNYGIQNKNKNKRGSKSPSVGFLEAAPCYKYKLNEVKS